MFFHNNIQLEDNETIQRWLEEYNTLENTERVYLKDCIYSFHEVVRESIKREYLKGDNHESKNYSIR